MDVGLFREARARYEQAHGDSLVPELWQHSSVLAWVRDAQGMCVYASPAFLARFGLDSPARLNGPESPVPARILARPPDDAVSAREGNGQGVRTIDSIEGPDGRTLHILMERFTFTGPEGATYTAAVGMDITEQKAQTDEMTRLAMTDKLTGLWNRRGFMFLAEHELKAARRRGTRSAILYVDVDGLKRVNDSFGHGEGDLLLQEAAILLRSEFRESDIIGRIGGDEFAVFANDVKGGVDVLRDRFSAIVSGFPKTRAQRAPLSLSVGIATWEPDQCEQLPDLLNQADRSLYEVRRQRARLSADRAVAPPG